MPVVQVVDKVVEVGNSVDVRSFEGVHYFEGEPRSPNPADSVLVEQHHEWTPSVHEVLSVHSGLNGVGAERELLTWRKVVEIRPDFNVFGLPSGVEMREDKDSTVYVFRFSCGTIVEVVESTDGSFHLPNVADPRIALTAATIPCPPSGSDEFKGPISGHGNVYPEFRDTNAG